MNKWILSLPLDLITKNSGPFEPELIGAIVSIESNGDSYANRYEKHYKYLYEVDDFSAKCNITINTEIVNQKTSWGLMQVMGGVAREYGFDKNLSMLTIPEIGLHYGVKHLKNFLDQYDDIELAVSSYNQGGPYTNADGFFKNQYYVNKVMYRYEALKNE